MSIQHLHQNKNQKLFDISHSTQNRVPTESARISGYVSKTILQKAGIWNENLIGEFRVLAAALYQFQKKKNLSFALRD